MLVISFLVHPTNDTAREHVNSHAATVRTLRKVPRLGTHTVTGVCVLAEDRHTQARLKFDETASHLQKLESTTRKAVCAAVKEFNKQQVHPTHALCGGGDEHGNSLGTPDHPPLGS